MDIIALDVRLDGSTALSATSFAMKTGRWPSLTARITWTILRQFRFRYRFH